MTYSWTTARTSGQSVCACAGGWVGCAHVCGNRVDGAQARVQNESQGALKPESQEKTFTRRSIYLSFRVSRREYRVHWSPGQTGASEV